MLLACRLYIVAVVYSAPSSPLYTGWVSLLILKVGVEKQNLYIEQIIFGHWSSSIVSSSLRKNRFLHPSQRNASTLWEEMEIVLKHKGLMLGNWVWWWLYASLFWCSELKVVWMFILTFIWLISPGFKPMTLVYINVWWNTFLTTLPCGASWTTKDLHHHTHLLPTHAGH